MSAHVIIAFFKYPSPGKVKTRLAASLGEVAAAAAYEELAAWSLQNLAGVREGVKCWIAYTPAEARVAVAEWLRGNVPALQWDRLLPQVEGDLGDRLWDAVETALVKEGAASVTLIGTDCPRLRADHFMQAQRWLEEGADVVFGPAKDGGYYLQALKSAAREMFTDIPWSQPETLQACLEKARKLDWKVAMLEELEDVDTLREWESWQKELSET